MKKNIIIGVVFVLLLALGYLALKQNPFYTLCGTDCVGYTYGFVTGSTPYEDKVTFIGSEMASDTAAGDEICFKFGFLRMSEYPKVAVSTGGENACNELINARRVTVSPVYQSVGIAYSPTYGCYYNLRDDARVEDSNAVRFSPESKITSSSGLIIPYNELYFNGRDIVCAHINEKIARSTYSISGSILFDKNEPCVQVITYAQNPLDNTCQQFNTPCEVPSGWVVVSSCNVEPPKECSFDDECLLPPACSVLSVANEELCSCISASCINSKCVYAEICEEHWYDFIINFFKGIWSFIIGVV